MSASDRPARVRGEIARTELMQLLGAQHQLRRAGRDSAQVALLITRKRAQVDQLVHRDRAAARPTAGAA